MKVLSHIGSELLALGGSVLLAICALPLLHNPTSLDDGLRHMAMARVMAEQGIAASGGWSHFLYQGYFSTVRMDPWFLADVLLVPLTKFGTITGLKMFAALQVLFVALATVLALRRIALPPKARALLLAILLLGETQFTGRLLSARPMGLMTGLFLLTLTWVLSRTSVRNDLCLALTLACAVLLSQLFIFPLLLCVIALVLAVLLRRWYHALHLLAGTAAGIAAGLILHPQPIAYLRYLGLVFLRIPFLRSIGLSAEMGWGLVHPTSISVWIVTGAVIVLCFSAWRFRRPLLRTHSVLFLLSSTICFLLLFAFYLRAIDFLWPLCIILIATLWSTESAVLRTTIAKIDRRVRLPLASGIALVLLVQAFSIPLFFLLHDEDNTLVPYHILNHVPPQSRVLNLDWHDFFGAVAVRPDLRYALGIDPTFTYVTDPDVWLAIRSLQGRHQLSDDIIASTLAHITARYPFDALLIRRQTFPAVVGYMEDYPERFRSVRENTSFLLVR